MKKLIILFILILKLQQLSFSQTQYVSEKSRYSIILPKGWYKDEAKSFTNSNMDLDAFELKIDDSTYYRFVVVTRVNTQKDWFQKCQYSEKEQRFRAECGIPLKSIISTGAIIIDNTYACFIEYENNAGTNATYICHSKNNEDLEYTIQTIFLGGKNKIFENVEDMLRKSFKFY